jgi:hypothetical protein
MITGIIILGNLLKNQLIRTVIICKRNIESRCDLDNNRLRYPEILDEPYLNEEPVKSSGWNLTTSRVKMGNGLSLL